MAVGVARGALRVLLWSAAVLAWSASCLPAALALAATAPAAQFVEEGQRLMALGDASGAVEMFNAAISKEPRNTQALYRRAVAFMSLGRNHQAENDLTKVIALDPASDQAYLRRGTIRLKQGAWADARADLLEFRRRQPSHPEVEEKLAQVALGQDRADAGERAVKTRHYAEALQALSEAIELAPQSSKLRLLRAEAHEGLGDVESTIADLKRAALFSGDDPSLFLRIARLHISLGELDAATEQLRQCLRSDPEYKPCLATRRTLKNVLSDLEKGQQLVQRGQWSAAAAHYEGLLEGSLGPNKGLPFQRQLAAHEFCMASSKLADHAKTLRACALATELNPGDTAAFMAAGEAHIAVEDYDAAVRAFHKARELEPNNRMVHEALQRADKLARNAKRIDYYKVLGVPRTATKAQIKKAYRKLAQQWHPDKYKGDDLVKAQSEMAKINMANEVLSDDELRARYDAGDDPNDPERNQHQGPHGHPFGGGFPFHFGGGQGGFHFHF